MTDTDSKIGFVAVQQPTAQVVELVQSFADVLTEIVETDIPAATDPLYEG